MVESDEELEVMKVLNKIVEDAKSRETAFTVTASYILVRPIFFKASQLSNSRKNTKQDKLTSCGHPDNAYYANGMCKNCYHLKGRTKKATHCDH